MQLPPSDEPSVPLDKVWATFPPEYRQRAINLLAHLALKMIAARQARSPDEREPVATPLVMVEHNAQESSRLFDDSTDVGGDL